MFEINGIKHSLFMFHKIRRRYIHSSAGLKSIRDTIYALSSGFGKCGVAVIRVSGPKAFNALSCIANSAGLKPRYAHLKNLKHPTTKELIDKGLVLWFPGPNSFSGEDCCEFQVHGGPAVVSSMLTALSAIKDLRPAEPGEFTRRAFYAGKLDLTEVEGLADLIHAETEAQRKQALIQATGALSKLYSQWRKRILSNVAHVEAYIDFAEDENIEDDTMKRVEENLKNLEKDIFDHLQDARKGERLREGVRTAVVGAPNVGKSSLMNLLCQKPISIVTDIPGTTRDIIESHFNIAGYPLVLADTAGLRSDPSDVVENEGISRAKSYLSTVDLILMVIDAQHLRHFKSFSVFLKNYIKQLGLSDELLHNRRIIYFINKTDLVPNISSIVNNSEYNILYISCLKNDGVTQALQVLAKTLEELCGSPSFEHPILSHARHRHHLSQALEAIQSYLAVDISLEGTDLAILAQTLRSAVRSIGKITGEVGTEEILDVIFKDFCIGK